MKTFAVPSPTQVLGTSLELANRNQMNPSSNIIIGLLKYEPIIDREVIVHFANGIKYKWQFEKFCEHNPETAEEFKCIVQKMITSEERTHE